MRTASLFFVIVIFSWLPVYSEIMKVNKQNGTTDEFEINSALHIYFEDINENEVMKVLKKDQTLNVFSLSDIVRITFNPGNETKDQPAEIREIAKVMIKDLKNYPNPFNPSTSITFDLEKDGFVAVEIYNSKGEMVKSLAKKHFEAGSYEFFWDGSSEHNSYISSGYYFTRVAVDGEASTKKMLLVK